MNYDVIAPYYDRLSRLVFGNSQHKAQLSLLTHLKEGDSILWVGGGEGRLLPEIDRLGLQLTIDYVEFSEVMISLVQKKNLQSPISIQYYSEDIREFIRAEKKYDLILTAFLFDNFNQSQAEELFHQLNLQLREGGTWLFVDFKPNPKGLFYLLTKTMLFFFRIAIKLQSKAIPSLNVFFQKDFSRLQHSKFYWGYIEAYAYKKNPQPMVEDFSS